MLHEHVYVYISIFIMWVYNNIILFNILKNDIMNDKKLKFLKIK